MRVVVGGRRLYKLNVLLVVLLLWCIPWWLYNRFIRTKEFHPMGSLKWEATPRWLSCAIPYVSRDAERDDCAAVKLDAWSVGHVLIYATVAMVLPGQWAAVLAISILCEAFEYAVGWRARWLMDPATNIVGYAIGHALWHIDLSKTVPALSTRTATAVASAGLALALFLNRPSMTTFSLF